MDLLKRLQVCVTEVRAFLQCDRLLVYQFQPDWSGIVVAESVAEGWRSALGDVIEDACFQSQTTALSAREYPIVIHDIQAAGYTDCHRQRLEDYQVKASLVVPIHVVGQVWGLLIGHQCSDCRTWHPDDVTLLQDISTQLAIAVQYATTEQQLQQERDERQQSEAAFRQSEAHQRALINAIPDLIMRVNRAGIYLEFVTTPTFHVVGNLTEIVGTHVSETLPADLAQLRLAFIHVALQTRAMQIYEQDLSLNGITQIEEVRVVPYSDDEVLLLVQDISARKQAEHALRKTEKQYQEAQRIAHLGNWELNLQTQVLYWSDEVFRIFEIDPQQFSASYDAFLNLIHPDDREQVNQAYTQSIRDRLPYQLVHRLLMPDGRIKYVQEQCETLYAEDGTPIVSQGTVQDITLQRTAELERERAEESLRQVVEGTAAVTGEHFFPELVQHISKALGVRYASVSQSTPDGFKILAFCCDQVLQPNQFLSYCEAPCCVTALEQGECYHPDSLQVIYPGVDLFTTLQAESYLGIGLRNAAGEPIGNLCVLHDRPLLNSDWAKTLLKTFAVRASAELERYQTAQTLENLTLELEKRVEERTSALQDRETQLRDFFENANDLIQSVRLEDGRFEYVNRTWRETLGYSDAEVQALTVFDILHPDYHRHCHEMMTQIQAGRVDLLEHVELVFLTKTQQEIIVEGSINCRRESDRPVATRAIFRDITERKQAEAMIRQQTNQERLLREISQRIRQSLNLQTIFDTACQEIRPVMQADRVGIFKFYPDSNFDDGEFVAESIVEGLPSVIAIRVHDHCFGDNYSSLYAKGRYHAIHDIYDSGLKNCHADILAQFQVRANLIVPLLCGDVLWGLLCVHQCAAPRHWQQPEIEFTQQLANQLAIAIQQADFYEQIQSELRVRQQAEAQIAIELRRQQALGAITQRIRESLDINEILATVTRQVKAVMHSDRVIVFRLLEDGRSQIVEEAVSDGFVILRDRHWDDEVWSQDILDYYWQGKPRIVPDVMNDIWTDCLIEYSIEGQIQSKIVAPVLQEVRDRTSDRWVTPCQTKQLWGVLVVHACHNKRIWQDAEAQLLQQIANQLAIAIQQANLYEQIQSELIIRQQTEADLRQTNEELARATRLKDEFLANMSHELRTPLNAILGMTEALQDDIFGKVNTEQIKALQTVERSATHLLELINDILDVAKIESGQIELDCAFTSVALLCQSSLAFIKQQALKKNIQLEIQLPKNLTHLPDLYVDERRIRQVLINLLNNAVKFTPDDGRIILDVKMQVSDRDTQTDQPSNDACSSILFSVIDTGIGIAPEHLNKLFQPFIQIDSALNRNYEGTGLGLALVKRIVELHGGRVGLTSELGVGSCFTIELPCTFACCSTDEIAIAQPPDALPMQNSPATPTNTTSSPLILLAEDNEVNITTVSSYLGAKGYRVLLANNGHDAIAIALAHQPDLILMDIQMPGMDGLEATRHIRQEPALVDVPIIALTALAMPDDRQRCLNAGATEYIAKPVRLKALLQMIQTLLVSSKRYSE